MPSDRHERNTHFEYCYELSWKMLKRQLEQELPNPAEADRMSFAELIREGAERGFVAHPERWSSYRYQRNLTSHTYDEEKAKAVHATALEFLADGRALLAALSGRNTHDSGS